jgi:hypothetical protein
MAEYTSADTVIEFDDSGDTLRVITPYVLTINGFDVEAAMEETTAFGSAWKQSKATGIRMVNNIVLGGNFNDTATVGPDVVFKGVATGPNSATRTFKLTYGGGLSSSVETVLKRYSRKPQKGITKYEAELEPTGAVTEA